MSDLQRLSNLLEERNAIDDKIAALIDRPALAGHIGEYIASRIFNISLCNSASQKSIDGYFVGGLLQGKSVNIKLCGKHDGLLNLCEQEPPDYYLVLAGPNVTPGSSRFSKRPFVISSVFLFESEVLHAGLVNRKSKIGVASSVPKVCWQDAQIYPNDNTEFPLSEEQRRLLKLFEQASRSDAPLIIGLLKGKLVVPDDFDEPLPDDLLDLFEGKGDGW